MPTGRIIVAHPDFRMMVLANRPGFPFLGNDFFGAMGMFCAYRVLLKLGHTCTCSKFVPNKFRITQFYVLNFDFFQRIFNFANITFY